MTINPLVHSVESLVKALEVYDQGAPERKLNPSDSYEQLNLKLEAEERELRKVQDAFYEVTKDRNCLANCRLADIKFMRKVAESAPCNEIG